MNFARKGIIALMAMMVFSFIMTITLPAKASASTAANPVLAISVPRPPCAWPILTPPFCEGGVEGPEDLPVVGGAVEGAIDFVTNPLGAMLKTFVDLTNDLVHKFGEFLQQVVATPIRPGSDAWRESLFSEAYGLARMIATAVFAIVTVVALVKQNRIPNVIQAFIAFFFIVGMGYVWYEVAEQFIHMGDGFAQATMDLYEPPPTSQLGNSMIPVPNIVNALGALIGGIIMLWFAFLLSGIFFVYELGTIFTIFLMLPAFAMMALGDRSKKFFSLTMAWFIGMIAGRGLAIGSMEMGQAFADNMPGATHPAFTTGYLIAGMILALIMQVVVLVAAYKGTTYAVGKYKGVTSSNVRGKVETTSKQRQKVSVDQAHAAQSGTKRKAVPMLKTAAASVAVTEGAKALSTRLGTGGVAKTLAGQAGRSHPLAAASMEAARVVHKRRRERTANRARAKHPPTQGGNGHAR